MYKSGYLDAILPSRSAAKPIAEPLNVARIQLEVAPPSKPLVAEKKLAEDVAKKAVSPKPPVKKLIVRIACLEVGEFPVSKAPRVARELKKLKLGVKARKKEISKPTSFMVYLPGKKGSKAPVSELKRRGITNYFVIKGDAPHSGSISLGVFKSEISAKKHRVNLRKKGLKGLRIAGRNYRVQKVTYQLKDIAEGKKASIARMLKRYPYQKMRTCKK